MTFVGIDDTDLVDTPGTNQIARFLADELRGVRVCRMILRQQLLFARGVRYTRHNSAATLLFDDDGDDAELADALATGLRALCPEGSDPGLCIARDVPEDVVEYGHACRRRVVTQGEARALAAAHGIHLVGLGGDEGGVIGALAAVGLGATGNIGRIVHIDGVLDDLNGVVAAAAAGARGVQAFVDGDTGDEVFPEWVDVGKHLRPSLRGGRVVLFVEPATDGDADHVALRRD